MSESSATELPRLSEGTILAGRYRVVRALAPDGESGVYDARDVAIAERRVALVVTAPHDSLAADWASGEPPVAALLDVVPLANAMVGVFRLPERAERLVDATAPSRAQRAAVLLDAYGALLHRASREPLRLLHSAGLWWLPAASGAKAVLVPAPARGVNEQVAADDDIRAFAGLLAQQLYGVTDESGRDRLPEAIGELLEAWEEQGAAGHASAEELAAAVGVGAAASRVPVPTAPMVPAQAAQARIGAARRRARVVARRETGAFFALLVALALGFSGLLRTEERAPSEGVEAAAPSENPRRRGAAEAHVGGASGDAVKVEGDPALQAALPLMPPPQAATLPPHRWDANTAEATSYRSLIDDGPFPRLISEADSRPNNEPYAVAYDPEGNGRVARIEHRESAGRFAGYSVFSYDAQGRVTLRSEYSSTNQQLHTLSFDYDAGIYEARRVTGEPTVIPCASVRFELDALGRYEREACLDAFGDPANFPEGYHEVRSDWDAAGTTLTESFFSASGEPIVAYGGYHTRMTRYDEVGRVRGTRFFGLDANLVRDGETGAARVAYDYGTYILRTYLYDESDAPILGHAGWHSQSRRFDEDGHQRHVVTRDTEGEPIARAGSRIARIEFETDSYGHVAALANYDARGLPTADGDNIHRVTYARDAHGIILQECHYGESGPIASARLGGAHCVSYGQDIQGQTTRVAYFGIDQRATTNNRTQTYQATYDYDAVGRLIAKWYRDAHDRPMLAAQGYFGVQIEYDSFGNESGWVYVDQRGGPMLNAGGITEVRLARDVFGREIQRCFFVAPSRDALSRPAALRGESFGAGATCILRTYEGPNLVELRYQKASGEPVRALLPRFDDPDAEPTPAGDATALDAEPRRAAIVRISHHADGTFREQTLFDVDGVSAIEGPLDCNQPYTCLDESGWGWYAPQTTPRSR